MSIRGAQKPGEPLTDDVARRYDALLVVSFGGPEGPADVMPFLERVTAGRGVPPARLREVAHHYDRFGGVSPLNAQNRALVQALEAELAAQGPRLPVYFGNRNWHPFIEDAVRRMRDDGVKRAAVFVTSAFSSYSGCRQYREDVIRALDAVGDGAPQCDKLRMFYNHPGFIEPNAANLRAALARVPAERRDGARVVFSAHSIPVAMARTSRYESELAEAARLVAELAGLARWDLAYQSRSGPAHVPWLGPDILDVVDDTAARGTRDLVVLPIGFISDHIEVLYDLDVEAAERAAARGLAFVRAATVGTASAFISMIRELVLERMTPNAVRRALGTHGPGPDVCALDCCPAPGRPGREGQARG